MITVPDIQFQDGSGNKFSETAIVDMGNVDYPNSSAPLELKIVNASNNAEMQRCLLDVCVNKYAGAGSISEIEQSFSFCLTQNGTYTSKLWIWKIGANEDLSVWVKYTPRDNTPARFIFNIRLCGMYRFFS